MNTKRLSVIILIALWCLLSLPFCRTGWAQQCGEDQLAANTIVIKKKVASVPAGGGACTDANPVGNCTGFLICQNFEGAGYDNSETWVADEGTGGDVDPDYTSTILRGSQSLRLASDTATGAYALVGTSSLTTYNELWYFFRIRITDQPDTEREIFQTYYATGTIGSPSNVEAHEMLWMDSTGKLYVVVAGMGNLAEGSHLLQTGTTHYVWMYVIRDASRHSTGWVKVSESITIPETNDMSWSDVDTSGDTAQRGGCVFGFSTYHSAAYNFIVDQFLVKTSAIGTACD